MRLGAMISMGLLLMGLGLPRPAVAQEQEEETTPAPDFAEEKLSRGLQNGTLGWTEIVARSQAEVQANGPRGLVKGLLEGISHGTIRTVTGVAEVATFWSPLPVRYRPPHSGPRPVAAGQAIVSKVLAP
jgi:putative exosortase-associated protein (TIGR04073 family)